MSIIQGIIQGLTEFLPISSSGHLGTFQVFFNIKMNNLVFNLALHLGTLISVIIVYKDIILNLFLSFKSVFFRSNKKSDVKGKKIIFNLIISVIPLFLMFVKVPIKNMTVKDIAKSFAEPPNIAVIAGSFICTAVFLVFGILASKIVRPRKKIGLEKISSLDALLIGAVQFIAAIFPGLSRSGSTLSVALMCGIDRSAAIDYSFLLGIPTILAAAILELKDIRSNNSDIDIILLLTGIITSVVVGIISINLFKWLSKKDKTWVFALYTFILGIFLFFIQNDFFGR